MASLKDLREIKAERERSVWITMRFPESSSRAGEPIESGDGKPWRVLIRSVWCEDYQKAQTRFNWEREFFLKLEALGDMGGNDLKQRLQAAMGATEEFMNFEARSFREHIIRDWENLSDDDVVINCTPENIKTYLFDEFPFLFDQINASARNGSLFGVPEQAPAITSPADLVGDIEKKALNGCDGDAASSSESAPPMEDSVTPTMTSSDSHDKASLPALA